MDCLAYQNRIHIRDLEPSMLNITLLCRVIAIASNVKMDNRLYFKFLIPVRDIRLKLIYLLLLCRILSLNKEAVQKWTDTQCE